jgi:hypothetical protein
MGKAEIECTTATQYMSAPHWYPLQFEERSYGELNIAFRLVPETEWNVAEHVEKNLLKSLYVRYAQRTTTAFECNDMTADTLFSE